MANSRAVIVGFSLLLVGMIWLRELFWCQEIKQLRGEEVVRQKITLTEPVRETMSNCIISFRGVEYRIRKEECLNKGLVSAEVGDKVEFAGRWKTIVIAGIQNEKSFIYVTNYAIKSRAGKSTLGWQQGLRSLYKLRAKLLEVYKKYLPEPEASLMAGIVLGEQAALPEEFAEALRKSGLMHVVAASGYNVTVVTGLLLTVLTGWVGRRASAIAAMSGVGVYVVLAGASPPVIRAGLMGVIALLALIQGRWYWGLWALGLSSGLMLMLWPWLLVSISFQLSVAATAGMMILVEPLRRRRLKIISKKNRVWSLFGGVINTVEEAFVTTVAATIGTLPIQVVNFGEVSWLGLMVNPLMLWMIPLLMYLGMIYVLLGIVWQESAGVLAWLVYPASHMFVRCVAWFDRIPFGISLVSGNRIMMAGWWLGWMGWAGYRSKKQLE